MRLIKNTTELIGIKDPNIIISLVFEKRYGDILATIEVQATLDYTAPSCPDCQGKMIKYDFQKPSKIPLLNKLEHLHYYVLKSVVSSVKVVRRVTVAKSFINR